jgi:hypothetical protein
MLQNRTGSSFQPPSNRNFTFQPVCQPPFQLTSNHFQLPSHRLLPNPPYPPPVGSPAFGPLTGPAGLHQQTFKPGFSRGEMRSPTDTPNRKPARLGNLLIQRKRTDVAEG